MAEIDRSRRYANSPKAPKKKGAPDKEEKRAEAEVDKTTAKGTDTPHPKDPDKAGKVGEDKGPKAGHSPTTGIAAVHERHGNEREDMHKRHHMEMGQMHERHAKEHKDMHERHAGELQTHAEEHAEHEAERTAGHPKELGKEKPEGNKGSEV